MNDRHPHSALREWRTHMLHPATLTALLGIGAVLGVAGPFGTDGRLGLAPRLVYWLFTVALTYGAGSLCDAVLAPRLARFDAWVRLAVTALATGGAVALVVLCINYVTFAWIPDARALPALIGSTFVIAAIVTVALSVIRQQSATPAVAHRRVRILDRIAMDKRGPLVALSVEDHYVRIQTTRGEDLVLLRLADAMNEVGDTSGAQVHRSHWAAFDQVRSARRAGDRAILTMSNGVDIPVSRANIAVIKGAGLLP